MNIQNLYFSSILLITSFTTVSPMLLHIIGIKPRNFTQVRSCIDLKKFRETGSCIGCNLLGEDLREIFKYIRENNPEHIIDLSHADLTRTNISGVIASKTNFSHACMRDAVATKAILDKAIFDNAQLQRTNFHETKLCKASFIGARCGGANFAKTNLTGANFEGAVLEPSGGQVYGPDNMGSFYQAIAKYANFKKTRWGCFDTTGADFTEADFSNSTKWFGVSFKDAIMQDVIYSQDETE